MNKKICIKFKYNFNKLMYYDKNVLFLKNIIN